MKYRKRPLEIDAFQIKPAMKNSELPHWALEAMANGKLRLARLSQSTLLVEVTTLEGEMKCGYGDWVIRGIEGELYPCKRDIFEKSYESVQG